FNQKLAARLLEKNGHAVVVADNGKEALAALEKHFFDMAFVQGHMADTDVVELTTLICKKRNRDGEHIPIVGMTTDAETRKRCIQAGMCICISRPAQAQELFDAIECVLLKDIDWGDALARVGGDEALLGASCDLFLGEVRDLMTETRESITCCD